MISWRRIRRLMARVVFLEEVLPKIWIPSADQIFRDEIFNLVFIHAVSIAREVLDRLVDKRDLLKWRFERSEDVVLIMEGYVDSLTFIIDGVKISPWRERPYPSMLNSLDAKKSTMQTLKATRMLLEEIDRLLERIDAKLRRRAEMNTTEEMTDVSRGTLNADLEFAYDWLREEVFMLRMVLTHFQGIEPVVFYLAPGISYPHMFDSGAVGLHLLYRLCDGHGIIQHINSARVPRYANEECSNAGVLWQECMAGTLKALKEAAAWIDHYRARATDAMKHDVSRMRAETEDPYTALLRESFLGIFEAIRGAKNLCSPGYDGFRIPKWNSYLKDRILHKADRWSKTRFSLLFREEQGDLLLLLHISRSRDSREKVFRLIPSELDRILEELRRNFENKRLEWNKLHLALELCNGLDDSAEEILDIALPTKG